MTGRWPVRHRGHLGGIAEMDRGSSLLGFRRGVHLGVHHGARHGQASKCWPVVQNHVHCATFHHISNDAPCQTHVMIHREVKARSRLMPSRGRGLDVAIQSRDGESHPGTWEMEVPVVKFRPLGCQIWACVRVPYRVFFFAFSFYSDSVHSRSGLFVSASHPRYEPRPSIS